jgi:hypothetical protein
MTFEQFSESLSSASAPPSVSDYLRALWYDAQGDWEQAHNIIQNIEDKTAAQIHAYLHRKEGDIWNADYWYNRAGRKRPAVSLENEWQAIVKELIHNSR